MNCLWHENCACINTIANQPGEPTFLEKYGAMQLAFPISIAALLLLSIQEFPSGLAKLLRDAKMLQVDIRPHLKQWAFSRELGKLALFRQRFKL